MALKLYRVVLTSRSALKVEPKRRWRHSQYHMTIRDDLQEDASGTPPKHTGLIYTVEVSAKNAAESIDKAVAYARQVTDQISVVHSVAVDYPLPQFSIDIDPANAHRELAQVLYNAPPLYHPRRTYDRAVYGSFFNHLDNLREREPKSALRVDRALHYLRNSYLDQAPIDQFGNAYIALEAISPLIRKKYSQPTTYQKKCSECHQDLFCRNCGTSIRTQDNLSGSDYIITEILGESSTAARKLREKRNSIFHAYTTLSTALEHLDEYTRLAQRAAVAGILDTLDLSVQQQSDFLQAILPVTGNPRVLVRATLYDLSVETLKTEAKYPQLYLQFCEVLSSDCPPSHAREIPPSFVHLYFGIKYFSGEWDLLDARWRMATTLEEGTSEPQFIIDKCTTPSTKPPIPPITGG